MHMARLAQQITMNSTAFGACVSSCLGGRAAQLIEGSILAENGAERSRQRAGYLAGHERVRGAAVVDGGRRHPVGAGGRRRRRPLHEGPRPLHERQRHLLRLRRHRHPHRDVPPHGHLRAPHQARLGGQPGLPRRCRRRRPPRARPADPLGPAPAARPRLAGEARASAQDGARGGRGGPDGGDAGAAVPDVPGPAGAAPVSVPERSGSLASAP